MTQIAIKALETVSELYFALKGKLVLVALYLQCTHYVLISQYINWVITRYYLLAFHIPVFSKRDSPPKRNISSSFTHQIQTFMIFRLLLNTKQDSLIV